MNKNLKNFPVWNKNMNNTIKIKSVNAKKNFHLMVRFENNIVKEYDCFQIMHRDEFKPLKNKAFLRSVKVDSGGYGVSWNDDIDISEYELWNRGKGIADTT
jgi:hypothetical protein